ncbi:hypothetical protein C7Y71_000175 [Pseudoprevotella muciniphila]|uniref:Uncharacterized protein n=1 Tax=Pseudoprevotella muciniphila TaxID=2133944 RepID=A0A5P8E3S3_9BACT|nr:hypothetical protein [Pseudoprevotella muciniphila]QFQ11574.1 hypothetical protein C7Y71_000175 [Pseudoprevotella muciniphila]
MAQVEHILSGQVLVNNTDLWDTYGVFLREERKGGHENLNALLSPSKTKAHVAVNIREQDGEDMGDTLDVKSEGRDVTLHFALQADSPAAFVVRYTSFIQFLKTGNNGWLTFNFPSLGLTLRMYAVEWPNGFTAISNLWVEGEQAGAFRVKFREPVPSF